MLIPWDRGRKLFKMSSHFRAVLSGRKCSCSDHRGREGGGGGGGYLEYRGRNSAPWGV